MIIPHIRIITGPKWESVFTGATDMAATATGDNISAFVSYSYVSLFTYRACVHNPWEEIMPRKYSPGASKDVEREMHAFRRGKLKSGKGGRGGTVRSREQAIAIGLSEARREGKRVPAKRA
jgi:hypothetical protein